MRIFRRTSTDSSCFFTAEEGEVKYRRKGEGAYKKTLLHFSWIPLGTPSAVKKIVDGRNAFGCAIFWGTSTDSSCFFTAEEGEVKYRRKGEARTRKLSCIFSLSIPLGTPSVVKKIVDERYAFRCAIFGQTSTDSSCFFIAEKREVKYWRKGEAVYKKTLLHFSKHSLSGKKIVDKG